MNTLLVLLTVFSLVFAPAVQAGCGCDKPPPASDVVIPRAAYPGMSITLFHPLLVAGQTWTASFRSTGSAVAVTGTVVSKRALSEGDIVRPQLVLTVPSIPKGPTTITVTRGTASFVISNTGFTTIGTPFPAPSVAPGPATFSYTTGVGADGVLYIAMSGLDRVCSATTYDGWMPSYPLQFGPGDVAITNKEGFFIEALDASTSDHFSISPPTKGIASSILSYYRHSFSTYCSQHAAGGGMALSTDPNYHVDGTAHTAYSTLIFAIYGTINNATPAPGQVTFNLTVDAR